MNKTSVALAFDVGERRIGVAKAVVPPRIAEPLTTLLQSDNLQNDLEELIEAESPDVLVVGRPRNQQGEPTAQTRQTEEWAKRYLAQWEIPIYWQDESLTSVMAEAHLYKRGRKYGRADVDALAASIILTDFLETRSIGSR